MLPLLLIVFSLVSERCLSQRPFEPVCKSDRGTLLMAPAETFLVPVKEFDASSATIFVRQTSTFHFKCLTEDENVLVKVDFKRKPRVGEIDSSLYQVSSKVTELAFGGVRHIYMCISFRFTRRKPLCRHRR